MKRREFLGKPGCCAAALAASAAAQPQDPTKPVVRPLRRQYTFEIEVVGLPVSACHAHKVGQRLAYPQDLGKICPWLRDSMSGILRAMEWGVVFPWDYDGTPYKKVSDPNGVSTEFVRCPDPTANGVVVKITRRAVKA
jgi:uncharacterized repeat protein (TIGR04076 family)